MPKTIVDDVSGEEIEVFTATEVSEREETARTAIRGEYDPKVKTLEEELSGAKTALGERASEFAQFRKLNDEQVGKLTIAERTIYENGLALDAANNARVLAETATRDAQIDGVIKVKSNGNPELAAKMKEMWAVIGLEATTPELIETKATMVLGALSTTVPDLVATANAFNGGTYTPPQPAKKEGESFADTEQGKLAAAELGLTIEAPKK